jgi:hypothetical protein
MFRAVPLPIIRISLTVYLELVYVIQSEDSFRAGPGWIPALLEALFWQISLSFIGPS